MRLSILLPAISFLAALGGCANQAQPVAGESLQPLAGERIAVSYLLVEHVIDHSELFYSTFDPNFSGRWNIEHDASGYAAAQMKAKGFAAASVHDLVEAADVATANKEFAYDCVIHSKVTNNALLARGGLIHANLPPHTFFLDGPTRPEYDAMITALRAKGYRYLLQLTAMHLHEYAPGYGMGVVSADLDARVVDLDRRRVVWNDFVVQIDSFAIGGDLKKLTDNDMAKTKEGVANGLAKIDFASRWHVTPGR
ncbi:MAG: hypothetical protein M3N82_07930 [Pseudomonadota bacterium]|nr:hypothetical protein [Pseudomonadota bacterium]